MMGDGVIEVRRMREAVEAADYTGPIEVEIFNEEVWYMPGNDALGLIEERYLEHVL
jgi:sugar phosphate isomerase/epimerase